MQAVEGHLHIMSAEGRSDGGDAAGSSAQTADREHFHIPSLLKQRVVEVSAAFLQCSHVVSHHSMHAPH